MQAAFVGIKWVVGDGKNVRFLEDIWLGNKKKFPVISKEKCYLN